MIGNFIFKEGGSLFASCFEGSYNSQEPLPDSWIDKQTTIYMNKLGYLQYLREIYILEE